MEEVIQNVECYECAFQKFVDAHETYLRFEVNEGMIRVANESEKEVGRKGGFCAIPSCVKGVGRR